MVGLKEKEWWLINKFIANGRLTRDPEIKFTQTNNTKVAAISVAVRRSYKNQSGEYDTDFFNCSAFGAQADFLEKYFKKGQEILISGHLQNRSWDTDTGEKRYATDVIIETIDFVGSKSNSETTNELPKEVEVKEEQDKSLDLPF